MLGPSPIAQTTAPRRNTKELLVASLPFTQEDVRTSLRVTLGSFALLALATAAAALLKPWSLRLSASIVEGLLIVRCFALYHDALHGALLRGVGWAKGLFSLFGLLVLTPPAVWRETHNYHHAHTAKLVGSQVGSFLTVNRAIWEQLPRARRVGYRVSRSGLTIALGYPLIFALGMCLSSFLRGPRRFWDSALALCLHGALLAAAYRAGGVAGMAFPLMIPLTIACALGGYLFYAQHNFPDVGLQRRDRWRYSRAALESSSYIEMGPWMRWFTGNLGYHHVHHLNAAIPFYRLPEAMASIPELQNPGRTSLKPKDVAACLGLDLWDEQAGRMVPLDGLLAAPSAKPEV